MIRKLAEHDREMTLDFLGAEPSINLFAIGDVEAFGFDEDFQELWGQFDGEGALEGVLLRFRESYIPYFKDASFDRTNFEKILVSAEGDIIISGKKSVIDAFSALQGKGYAYKETFFCELNSSEKLPEAQDESRIKFAQESDSERIVELMEKIEEFSTSQNMLEAMRHKIRTKTGRVYYLENEEGKILSVAQTTAENSKSAMIVGVATLPDERNKGYASQSMNQMCKDLINEGKTLCLFYNNPEAGKIYHRLGFEQIDKWVMIEKMGM